MTAVRYVFLSDLHFGERNSVLTDPSGPDHRGPLEPNAAFRGLISCLHDVARANPPGARPRLVLLGDAFELALAPTHVAFEIFTRFVADLFSSGESLFDPRLVFVPGNHDHGLWTTTRDELLRAQIEEDGGRLRPAPAVTPAFDLLSPRADGGSAEPVRSEVLTRLLRRRVPHRDDLEVHVAYPNLGILEGGRAVVAHHGHFMDGVYLLMSTLSRQVFGGPTIEALARLEADNGAWIDFVWSSLGREGAVGADLRRSYDLLQSDGGKILFASRIAAALVSRARRQFSQRLRQRLLLPALLRVLDAVERTDVRRTLPGTDQVSDDVIGYCDGPLARAVGEELRHRGTGASHYTYIYGHTHRPLAQRAVLPTQRLEVEIFNTGGWVVDTPLPRPATSGGMVLVGERLESVVVGMGAQGMNPHLGLAQVKEADGAAAPTALRRHLEALVARPEGPWRRACEELGSAVLRRRDEHLARLLQELEQLTAFERLALRSEYILKLALRRRKKAQKQMRALLGAEGEALLRMPRILREKSPVALPS